MTLRMVIKSASKKTIQEAASILIEGGLVGMPTETVYGLAANALDDKAVASIFEAKGRPAFNPLIIHVPDLEAAQNYVEINDHAKAAAKRFWPGPLTMILPRKSGCGISELASAGLETLAIRVPNHKVAIELLKSCGVPLAAPSANKSGSLSPTSPVHVHASLKDKVDMILAGGASEVGLESTVLDLSGEAPLVLRPGGISAEDISEVLGVNVDYAYLHKEGEQKPKSPGMLLKHYAPRIPVRINAVDVAEDEALLGFGSLKFMGVKGGGFAKDLPEERIRNLSEESDLHEAASNLFAMLKELDDSGARAIAVMSLPDVGIGKAINDRLRRAAEG
ncbi:MAG: threonylcarbamoyl-AMP synthase [Micavibrio sp. TMED27]|nr:MAG: threonylcarbamoyl-AMP synthase [Micavibrio sp. TMED27]